MPPTGFSNRELAFPQFAQGHGLCQRGAVPFWTMSANGRHGKQMLNKFPRLRAIKLSRL
jgi:hypothetical protein